jgi:hypothetical protein
MARLRERERVATDVEVMVIPTSPFQDVDATERG